MSPFTEAFAEELEYWLYNNEKDVKGIAEKAINAKKEKAAKKTKEDAGWATRFVGAWEDDRTADEIVDDIRSARTTNNIDIEL